jgi:hypothetical protein
MAIANHPGGHAGRHHERRKWLDDNGAGANDAVLPDVGHDDCPTTDPGACTDSNECAVMVLLPDRSISILGRVGVRAAWDVDAGRD